jgi:hypothetical protein
MLAYHVEWHLRDALAPLLFHDTELEAARATVTLAPFANRPFRHRYGHAQFPIQPLPLLGRVDEVLE